MIYNVSEDGYNMEKKIYIYIHTVICGGEKLGIERINIWFGKNKRIKNYSQASQNICNNKISTEF